MKSILIEIVLVSGAILFWIAVLSVAVVFPVFALSEKIEASMARSPIGRVAPHFAPASR